MVVRTRGRVASTPVVYASLAAVVTSVPLTILRIVQHTLSASPFTLEQRAITSAIHNVSNRASFQRVRGMLVIRYSDWLGFLQSFAIKACSFIYTYVCSQQKCEIGGKGENHSEILGILPPESGTNLLRFTPRFCFSNKTTPFI